MSEREFIERRVDAHHERLRAHWTACVECGGHELRRPVLRDLELAPECDGVCAGCGALYTCDPAGAPQLLVSGYQTAGIFR